MARDTGKLVVVRDMEGAPIVYGLGFERITERNFRIQTFVEETCIRIQYTNSAFASHHGSNPHEELLQKLLTTREYSCFPYVVEEIPSNPNIRGTVWLATVMHCSRILHGPAQDALLFGVLNEQHALKFIWRYAEDATIREKIINVLTAESIIDLLTEQQPFVNEEELVQHIPDTVYLRLILESRIEKKLQQNSLRLLMEKWYSLDSGEFAQWLMEAIRSELRSLDSRMLILSFSDSFCLQRMTTTLKTLAEDESLAEDLHDRLSEIVLEYQKTQ